jgi:hypothetical protein
VRWYVSQTIADDVRHLIERDERPAVLVYSGDYDASGIDIERDLVKRVRVLDHTEGAALTSQQIEEQNLPELPAKPATPTREALSASTGTCSRSRWTPSHRRRCGRRWPTR